MQFTYFGFLFLNFLISIQGENLDLNVSYQNWKSIDRRFFNNPEVTSVHLRFNGIEKISEDAFYNLPNLLYLNLEGNNLKERYLCFNYLSPKLRSLILDNAYDTYSNDNNDFGIDLISPNLNLLSLSDNNITELKMYRFPVNIRILNLKNNFLTEVPALFNTTNITFLYLSNNRIEVLKEGDFRNMPLLTTLSLNDNKVKEIKSDAFIALKHLKFLYLEKNDLRSIHSFAFDSQSDLFELDLKHNDIRFFDGEIVDNNRNLLNLDLSQNFLEEIPVIKNAVGLRVLDLSNNNIRILREENFKSIVNLENLNLSNNSIENIRPGTFDCLKKLKVLSLNSNELTILPDKWTLPLVKLELLHLQDNLFEKFGDLSLNFDLSLQKANVSYTTEKYFTFNCYVVNEEATRVCIPVKIIQQSLVEHDV